MGLPEGVKILSFQAAISTQVSLAKMLWRLQRNAYEPWLLLVYNRDPEAVPEPRFPSDRSRPQTNLQRHQ